MFFPKSTLSSVCLMMALICKIGLSFSAEQEPGDVLTPRISTHSLVRKLTGTVAITGFQEARFTDQLNGLKKQALGGSFKIDYQSKDPVFFSEDEVLAMDQRVQLAIDLTLHYALPLYEGLEKKSALEAVVNRERLLSIIRTLEMNSEQMNQLLSFSMQEQGPKDILSSPFNRLSLEFFCLPLSFEERSWFENGALKVLNLSLRKPEQEGWNVIRVLAHRFHAHKSQTFFEGLVEKIDQQIQGEKGEVEASWVARMIMLYQKPST